MNDPKNTSPNTPVTTASAAPVTPAAPAHAQAEHTTKPVVQGADKAKAKPAAPAAKKLPAKKSAKSAPPKPVAKKAPAKKRASPPAAVKQAVVSAPAAAPAVAVKKPVAKPVVLAAAKPVKKPAQAKKAKLVRDSFTMPAEDFAFIDRLKLRTLEFKRATKKSELLRAGLHALNALSDAQLKKALDALVPLKAGRPKNSKA